MRKCNMKHKDKRSFTHIKKYDFSSFFLGGSRVFIDVLATQ